MIHADHIARTKKKLNQILAERTGQPLEVIERDTERDNFMTAQEAADYGLIDKVIYTDDRIGDVMSIKRRKQRQSRFAAPSAASRRSRPARLIAGPGVYICDECIELCMSILEDEDRSRSIRKSIYNETCNRAAEAAGNQETAWTSM